MVESLLHQAANFFKEFAVEGIKVKIFLFEGQYVPYFFWNFFISNFLKI